MRFVSITGKYAIQASTGAMKSAIASLQSLTSSRLHYKLTSEVFGTHASQTLDAGITLAESLVEV